MDTNICKTKYPILLVHGIGFRDNIKLKKFWGTIPDELRKNGAQVYMSNTDAMNTHQENAKQIRARIFEIMSETKSKKINIIAYSKGGIEARYAISKLDMAPFVASLTTIATPHRGTELVNMGLNIIDKLGLTKLFQSSVTLYAKALGDNKPQPLEAFKQCSPQFMEKFNTEVNNNPLVYYQSYAAVMKSKYPRPYSRIKHKLLYSKVGENDGVVPLKSATWGEFKGAVTDNPEIGVSHFEIIGFTKATTFNPDAFFSGIVTDLKYRHF